MAIRHDKVSATGMGIEGLGAEALDGIHTEENLPRTTGLADAAQVQGQTGPILDRTDGDKAGGRGNGIQQRLFRVTIQR